MAGQKQIVDAELLLNKLRTMQGRQWSSTYYSGNSYYGNGDFNQMMNQMGQQMEMRISSIVNQAMTSMMVELVMAIEQASRLEQGNMCGLCRPHEGELPVDFRGVVR